MVVLTQNKTTPVDTAIELWGEMYVESHKALQRASTLVVFMTMHDISMCCSVRSITVLMLSTGEIDVASLATEYLTDQCANIISPRDRHSHTNQRDVNLRHD